MIKLSLDHIDTEILECLKKDGRISYSAIAKKVGLTSTAVGQRIQKMKDEGLILGFSTTLDRKKLGISIQAIITLKLNFSKIDSFYRKLLTFSEVEYCYRVTGEDCIIMKVNLKDNPHLLDFINQISLYGFSKSNIIIDQII